MFNNFIFMFLTVRTDILAFLTLQTWFRPRSCQLIVRIMQRFTGYWHVLNASVQFVPQRQIYKVRISCFFCLRRQFYWHKSLGRYIVVFLLPMNTQKGVTSVGFDCESEAQGKYDSFCEVALIKSHVPVEAKLPVTIRRIPFWQHNAQVVRLLGDSWQKKSGRWCSREQMVWRQSLEHEPSMNQVTESVHSWMDLFTDSWLCWHVGPVNPTYGLAKFGARSSCAMRPTQEWVPVSLSGVICHTQRDQCLRVILQLNPFGGK